MSGLSKAEFEAAIDDAHQRVKIAVAERMRNWAAQLVAVINAIDFDNAAEEYLDSIEWSITGIDDGEVCQSLDEVAKGVIDETPLD